MAVRVTLKPAPGGRLSAAWLGEREVIILSYSNTSLLMNVHNSVGKKAKIQIQGLDLHVHVGSEDSSPLLPTYKHSFL